MNYVKSRKKKEVEEYREIFIDATVKIIGILYIIIAAIAMYKGEQAMKMADEVISMYEKNHTYKVVIAEKISVEDVVWRYIDSIEIQQLDIDAIVIETEEIAIIQEEEEEQKKEIEVTTEVNYIPSDAEREFAYCLAFGEAGIEDSMGQTLVINVAINNMVAQGYSNLIEEFTAIGRYSSVIDGQVYNCGKIVLLDDVPQNVKDAVDAAFEYDYTEEMLKEEAEKLGITDPKYWEGGATYFYNPAACSENQNKIRENIKVKFKYGNHIFYRYWDK